MEANEAHQNTSAVLKCFLFLWMISSDYPRNSSGWSEDHPPFLYGEGRNAGLLDTTSTTVFYLQSICVCREASHTFSYSFNKHLVCTFIQYILDVSTNMNETQPPLLRLFGLGGEKVWEERIAARHPQGAPRSFRDVLPLLESQTFILMPDFAFSPPTNKNPS